MTSSSPSNMAGKTILVTGGGRGLGAAICQELAADGAHILVGDIDEEAAHATAQRLGAQADAVGLDVGNESAVRAALDRAVSRFGHLDAVVNNAAIDLTVPIEELGLADWDRILRTNLTGPFLISKHACAHMRSRGGGHIVNIASTASKRAWPNAAVYHATKWGLLGLSHALHAELRPLGIKVSAVVAGGMRTPFLLDRFADIDVSTLQDPANVARAVRFVLMQPEETVIPEIMVLPMKETSWP
ncbi:2,5-dichloro-2,5-cyclohexadiene-1,4-diol dehydrogenase [Pigmentiphaga humi]|uniref:2,5-dichloro-2,5-cyclohexadiene-1,4-diol dehydrogenase n=1 Tax=Pigmentiphaga humi TaxID=2478468 RepID=A0A3P4B105_9BURK|nr:SDR family oxidoreductase [Pigmentiphaga humi]VCU69977.1 2,5-dichloro-2,5-cyclohexadiene-1,4-diol dehydrogenase [Pigmentiphaga humi]